MDLSSKQEIEPILLSNGEKVAINHQLLRVLILANAPLSFIEDAEVIKLFRILKPEYKLLSRKWISIDVLDNIHENVQCNIQRFISDSMFLTLSGDRWTNVSKNKLARNETLKLQYPYITHWATFTKASETILQIQTKSNLISIINDNEFWINLESFHALLKPYDYVIKILETETAILGQVAASWAWLRETVYRSPFTNNDFQNSLILEINNRLNPSWLLYIQENAYSLFCTFYPDHDQDKFIDEWLNYANQEVPNLSEFAYRLLSIPPNSATSERVWSLLDDIHMFDVNNEEKIPILTDIFDSKSVEKSLNFYVQQS
ncbi:9960_t:CDS:2, partial [Dentiscutata heterogama]